MKKLNISNEDIKKLEPWQKIGITCLLIVITGFIGWLVEFFFGWYNGGMKGVYWQGGNFMPWINMYSIGTFLILASAYRYRDKPLKVCLVSMLVCGIFEYFTALFFDKVVGRIYWDYSNLFLNINGYVCLLSISCFAIGGLFLTYVLMPALIKLSKKIPKKTFLTVSVMLCTIVLVDEFYNFAIANLFKLPDAKYIYAKYTIFK